MKACSPMGVYPFANKHLSFVLLHSLKSRASQTMVCRYEIYIIHENLQSNLSISFSGTTVHYWYALLRVMYHE